MPDAVVIHNPHAGRGRSRREVWRLTADAWASRGPGDPERLARKAADGGYRTVIAAGGDGTVHEVANGLLASGRDDITFSVWPVGSGNDYAHHLGLTDWWQPANRRQPKGTARVDVGVVRAAGRERFFVNGLGVGFNGAVTLESRGIRGLSGMPLYATALVKALVKRFATPPTRVESPAGVHDVPSLGLTVNLAKREGTFPVTPRASLTDGLFDCIQYGPLTRWGVVKLLPRLATGTLPGDHPKLNFTKADRLTVSFAEPATVHTDGEFFCLPEDGVRRLEIELLPSRLQVECFPEGGEL